MSVNMLCKNFNEINLAIDSIDPIRYGKTRNYLDGAVSRLSPYISRGVISTKYVAKKILAKGYHPNSIEIFLKELAWRDYYQQVWRALGDGINKDIKKEQENIKHHQTPSAIIEGNTGIQALDEGIQTLYETGYVHNHLRMYLAATCCNIAQSHWLNPAQWMYYHLLDADWASNALSWQWVAGSFSSKKYYANQENINHFCKTTQQGTFLDHSYEALPELGIPLVLHKTHHFAATTQLPKTSTPRILQDLPTYVYNFYNLDPLWAAQEKANRIILIEPSIFEAYPISEKSMNFFLALGQQIKNAQVFVGDFAALKDLCGASTIHFKEHPLNQHYQGIEHARDWLFPNINGYFPSFFSYWKKCERLLPNLVSE